MLFRLRCKGLLAYKNGPTKEAVFGLSGKTTSKADFATYQENRPGVSVALSKKVVQYRNDNHGSEPPQERVAQRASQLFVEHTAGGHTRAEYAHKYGYADVADIGNGYCRAYLPNGNYKDIAQDSMEYWPDEIARGEHGNMSF